MKFEALKRRVAKHERLVEGRMLQTQSHWSELKTTWRDSWTPLRIVATGLISGFIVGRSDPVRAIGKLGAFGGGGAKVLQMVTAVSGLFASFQASTAADQAEQAADKADDAADAATDPAQAPRAPRDAVAERASIRREPSWPPEHVVPPRPAEAATELSEDR